MNKATKVPQNGLTISEGDRFWPLMHVVLLGWWMNTPNEHTVHSHPAPACHHILARRERSTRHHVTTSRERESSQGTECLGQYCAIPGGSGKWLCDKVRGVIESFRCKIQINFITFTWNYDLLASHWCLSRRVYRHNHQHAMSRDAYKGTIVVKQF